MTPSRKRGNTAPRGGWYRDQVLRATFPNKMFINDSSSGGLSMSETSQTLRTLRHESMSEQPYSTFPRSGETPGDLRTRDTTGWVLVKETNLHILIGSAMGC